jgi:hypothetical protein
MTSLSGRQKTSQNGLLFRAEALDHYAKRNQEIVWPQLTLPARLTYLWLSLLILIPANLFLWLIVVSSYFTEK